MFGLIVFGLLGIYLIVLVVATRVGYRIATEAGVSMPKRILAAAVGFLIIYLPVFWDHIPTVVMHRYSCEKEAGFWIYKPIEKWKTENPGVAEAWVIDENPKLISHDGDENSWTNVERLNQRINIVSKRIGPLTFHRWRREGEWIDSKSNEVLARYVDFSTSPEKPQAGWSSWKLWLEISHCPAYQEGAAVFGKSIEEFKGARR